MIFKESWNKANNWFRRQYSRAAGLFNTELDEEGLIGSENVQDSYSGKPRRDTNEVAVTAVSENKTSLGRQQESFNRLVDQLEGINTHLSRQVTQHAELMRRISELPSLLEKLPEALDGQRKIIDQFMEQSRAATLKNRQFVEAVEQIPAETARQSEALVNIGNQLSAAAEVDLAMSENFNRFNDTLVKLNQTGKEQRQSILEMNKSFTASDRYMKYLVSRQSRRFMWVFIIAMCVCVFSILALVTAVVLIFK
ncbi:MAG: hypothetical protein ABIG61_09505 [Planctomycetota bacterium]